MDHAWTFRPNLAREQLARIPGLAERMAALMDIEPEEFGSDEKRVTDEILVQMWRFANTYWVQAQSVTVTPLGQGKSVTLTNYHCKKRYIITKSFGS